MMSRLDSVQVCVDLERFAEPRAMGMLRRQVARSGEILSFEYDRSWLAGAEAFPFDPDLALVSGPQYPAADRATFGIFLDSSPDRWGRVLMQRRESLRARDEGRRPRILTDWDFLLGVHDETRLGALRFRRSPGEPFLDLDDALAAPPITSLSELQQASLRFADSRYTTFVAQRFDRTAGGGRLAFVSAMTLTQRIDGEPGASYLELVDLLQSRGSATRADCEQLFRRVVFSILIHNTDDHLRNHGFFIDSGGLRLSPAFDINPSIERRELTLAINEVETACDVAIALEASRDYGLALPAAEVIVEQVRAAVARWRDEAVALGILRSEQELMAPAFEG